MTVNVTYREAGAVVPGATTIKNSPLSNGEIDGNFKSVKDAVEVLSTSAGAGLIGVTPVGDIASTTVQGVLDEVTGPTGAVSVGYIPTGTGAVATTTGSKLDEIISVFNFMTKAQIEDARSGNAALDSTAAIQKAIDALTDGQTLEASGSFLISDTLYCSNKNNVTLDFSKSKIKCAHGSGASLIVHGGPLTRINSVWPQELLTFPYETTVTSKNVTVKGFRPVSSDGSKKATAVFAYFADDFHIDADVSDSNGNGVNLYCCARPSFGKISARNFSSYGLFAYQCHALDGEILYCENGGRGFEMKQRHKLYDTLDHKIKKVELVDLKSDAWATSGVSFNDLVAAGASAEAIANRNFTGHEITRNIGIESVVLTFSGSADAAITNPSFAIGAFADQFKIQSIVFNNNMKTVASVPLVVGSTGDIARGQSSGGTFGEGHTISSVHFSDYLIGDSKSLVQYGVSCTINNGRYRKVSVARFLDQAQVSALPFGVVDFIEYRGHVGTINLALGPISENGARVKAETLRFITGGNRLKFSPFNRSSNTAFAPWYINSADYITIGFDELTVLDGGSAASDHQSTYVAFLRAARGNAKLKISATAPVLVQALSFGAEATREFVLAPSSITLTGSPTGSKVGISLAGEVTNQGGHVFTGSFNSTISDTTGGKNSQNLRRLVYLTAAPTTGTWTTGDRVENIAPAIGSPKAWRCTLGGTPGTWVSEGNL